MHIQLILVKVKLLYLSEQFFFHYSNTTSLYEDNGSAIIDVKLIVNYTIFTFAVIIINFT